MAISYEFDEKENIVYVTATGFLTSLDIMNYVEEWFQKINKPGVIELIDMNGVCDFLIQHSDVTKLVDRTKESVFIRPAYSVFIASNAASKKISELLKVLIRQAEWNAFFYHSKQDAINALGAIRAVLPRQ